MRWRKGSAGCRDVKLDRLPRMADFALWGAACESEPGAFMTAYDENRADATALIVEHDAVAQAVRGLAQDRTGWTGSATELLDVLVLFSTETARRAKDWPQSPRAPVRPFAPDCNCSAQDRCASRIRSPQ